MKDYSYQIFVPGGNDTALVFGLESDIEIRKYINDDIMKKFPNVEQVGFISKDISQPQLLMAGGEFCGNATRSAAWYYLKGLPGELRLKVSGVKNLLRAGVNKENEAWAQMPVCDNFDNIELLKDGYFLVKMEGITHIVIMPKQSAVYLKSGIDLRDHAKNILSQFKLLNDFAAGVMFVEDKRNILKIHPCVYVSGINTMFYETACGSGTVAVGMVMASTERKSTEVSLVQPSLKSIKSNVKCQNGKIIEAFISGEIETDNILHRGRGIGV